MLLQSYEEDIKQTSLKSANHNNVLVIFVEHRIKT